MQCPVSLSYSRYSEISVVFLCVSQVCSAASCSLPSPGISNCHLLLYCIVLRDTPHPSLANFSSGSVFFRERKEYICLRALRHPGTRPDVGAPIIVSHVIRPGARPGA